MNPPSRGLSRAELLALPAVVDIETAARALQLGRTKAYELAKTGRFPCRVLRIGNTYRIATADLLTLLGLPVDTEAPAEPSSMPVPTNRRRRRSRPAALPQRSIVTVKIQRWRDTAATR